MTLLTVSPPDTDAQDLAAAAPVRRHRWASSGPLVTLLLLDLLALVPLVLTLVTPRLFQGQFSRNASAIAAAFSSSNRPWGTYVGRTAVVVLVLFLVFALLQGGARLWRGLFVVAGFAYAAAFTGSYLWSDHPGGQWQAAATLPLVILAFAIAPLPSLRDVHRHALGVLVFYAVGSFLAIAVVPGVAVERGYTDGILPWPEIRLHGITPHANALGAMMAVGLVLHLLGPALGGRVWRFGVTTVLTVALVLSQSKTTLLVLAVVLAVTFLLRRRPSRALRVGAVLGSFAVTALLPFVAGSWANHALTGRPDVWRITLDAWQQSPVFGYGLGLWDYKMKLAYLPELHWAPGQAHNELVQTLGQLGLVGAVALVVLAVAFARRTAVAASPALPLLVGLVMLLVLRGSTETALGRSAPEIGPFLLIITILFARQNEWDSVPSVPAPRREGEQDRPASHIWTVLVGSLATVSLFAGGIATFGGSTPAAAKGNKLAANAPITEEMFGTHILRLTRTPRTPWPSVTTPAIRIWDTGTTWADIETAPGVFKFQKLDQQIALAEQHRAKVVLTLGMTPRWASPRPDEPSPYGLGAAAPTTDYKAWRAYVRALAERYKGRVEAYEVWNEPVEAKYYTGTPEQLSDLTRETKYVLTASDPKALVVSPAPYWGADTQQFLQRYLHAGARKFVDVLGIHLYARQPEMLVPIMQRMRQLMLSEGLGDKPIWNTETGYGNRVKEPYSDEEARGIVARSYLLASGNGVSRFYWYAWDDRKWVKLYLVEPDLTTPTPAAHALEETQKLLVGATNTGCSRDDANGVWSCRLHRDSGDSLVLWQPDRPTTVALPGDAVAATKLDGSPLPRTDLQVGVEPVVVQLRTS